MKKFNRITVKLVDNRGHYVEYNPKTGKVRYSEDGTEEAEVKGKITDISEVLKETGFGTAFHKNNKFHIVLKERDDIIIRIDDKKVKLVREEHTAEELAEMAIGTVLLDNISYKRKIGPDNWITEDMDSVKEKNVVPVKPVEEGSPAE